MANFSSPADAMVKANLASIFGQTTDGGVPDNTRGGDNNEFFQSQVADSFGGAAPDESDAGNQGGDGSSPDLSWMNGLPPEPAAGAQSGAQSGTQDQTQGGEGTQAPTQTTQSQVSTSQLPPELQMDIKTIMNGLQGSVDKTFNVAELDKQFGEVTKENNLGFSPTAFSDADITAIGEGDYRPISALVANAQAATMHQTVIQAMNLVKGYMPSLFETYAKQYETARTGNNTLHAVHGNFKENPASQQLSVILAQRYLSHKPGAQASEVIAKVKEAMQAQNPVKPVVDDTKQVPINWSERPAILPV